MKFFLAIIVASICTIRSGVFCRGGEPIPATTPNAVIKDFSAALRSQWSGREDDSCNVICDDRWTAGDATKPAVVLVPGMLAKGGSMALLRQALERQEFAIATFQYSDRMGIEAAAKEFNNELQRLHAQNPQRKVVLVTHSMGGIIARAAIESADHDPAGVSGLIMISPPNHGSALADFSMTELANLLAPGQNANPDMTMIDDAVDGFLGEAKDDLRPGSPLLTKLNSGPRAAGVQYKIIAGTGGPVRSDLVDMSLALGSILFGEQPDLAPILSSAQKLARTDEWNFGRGDGVVSVESTRLAGIDDFVTLDFGHNDFGKPNDGSEPNQFALQAADAVVAKINAMAD